MEHSFLTHNFLRDALRWEYINYHIIMVPEPSYNIGCECDACFVFLSFITHIASIQRFSFPFLKEPETVRVIRSANI